MPMATRWAALYISAEPASPSTIRRFVDNQTNGTNNSFGGAIVNAGTLSINGATFTGNAALGSTAESATPSREAAKAGRSGTWTESTATINLTTFTANKAVGTGTGDAEGGAICNEDAYVAPLPATASPAPCPSAPSRTTRPRAAVMLPTEAATPPMAAGAVRSGICRVTNLAVLNCSFAGNQANSGGGTFTQGGAIDNQPAVTVKIFDSQFINNAASSSSAGAGAEGGAVDNYQTMTISDCQFTENWRSPAAWAASPWRVPWATSGRP